jgi:hypothetical protein
MVRPSVLLRRSMTYDGEAADAHHRVDTRVSYSSTSPACRCMIDDRCQYRRFAKRAATDMRRSCDPANFG